MADLARLEAARAAALLRLEFVGGLARAIEGAEDLDHAMANAFVMLGSEPRLRHVDATDAAVRDAFRPVVITLDNVLNCEGQPDHAAVALALDRFEAWHREVRQRPVFEAQAEPLPQGSAADA
jgi:hypothetical protein